MRIDSRHFLLYGVTDPIFPEEQTIAQMVEKALRGGVTCVQLREKNVSFEKHVSLALSVKQVTDQYGVPLVINDNVDVALACDADGVHLGQDDMPVKEARNKLGEKKIIGVTVKTVEQGLKAEAEGADYLGAGAVFPTITKKDARSLSIEKLTKICASVSIPVVAIGGIHEKNILELKGTGISGVAVVSGIFGQDDIEEATRRLHMKAAMIVNPRASIKGAIFDMDGTLLDSMSMWETITEDYLTSIGYSPEKDLREKVQEFSLDDASYYLKKQYNLPYTPDEIVDHVNELIGERYAKTIPMKDGVLATLDQLKSKGIKMYVATATDRQHVESSLKRLEILDYFQGIVTCREAGRGKKFPDIYYIAAKAMGTQPSETLVFEDALYAAVTAKNAGFQVIAIADKSQERHRDELKRISNRFVESFSEY